MEPRKSPASAPTPAPADEPSLTIEGVHANNADTGETMDPVDLDPLASGEPDPVTADPASPIPGTVESRPDNAEPGEPVVATTGNIPPDLLDLEPGAIVKIEIPHHHRTVTEHQSDECNRGLTITVCDPPGAGGASHLYLIEGMDASQNPAVDHVPAHGPSAGAIIFQNGPVLESGANGLTHEALLAVVIDRLRSFQAGPYACAENARALLHCQAALGALGQRSAGRAARGVEGTSAV